MSHAIYLLEAKLQVALRTATQLLPLVARHRKAKRGVLKFATVSRVVYLIATLVAIDTANSCQTSASRS
ncbi:hypothetical protein SAMN02745116_00036 [Pilibacter termitis]|uniref:Uncharacterized protein n=1 Tax=Pilibacter termitis TaxID=263852 RepID=A0A1T4K2C9_9ENTE|nr:hypothetical protein [Pilibacter termitis]SJZ36465.1 hypothetical protein SAMN02745116_00036 [Pilibacter termitis]